ncbi:MAG: vWA domain-containing protein [Promethearchaeota archaeon]
MSPEVKLFIETAQNLGDDIYISSVTADQIGVKDGDLVKVSIPEENFETTISVRIDPNLYDFLVRIDEKLPELLGFKADQIVISPTEGGMAPPPSPGMNAPAPPPVPSPPGMGPSPPAPGAPAAPPPVPTPPGMGPSPPAPGAPPSAPSVPTPPTAPPTPSPSAPPVPTPPTAPPTPPPSAPPVPTPSTVPSSTPSTVPPTPPTVPQTSASSEAAPPSGPAAPPSGPAAPPSGPAAPPSGPAAPPSGPAAPPSGPAAPPTGDSAETAAEEEYEIVTETQWELVPDQYDSYGVQIVDAEGNALYGMDDEGYPLDSQGAPFYDAQFNEITVEKKVPKKKKKTKIVQVLVPNQVDAYGVEIVDSENNPVYGLDESGWYALDSTGQPFQETQWMEMEVEEEEEEEVIEEGPYPKNMTDDYGRPVVDENGWPIYGEDEFNCPLDPDGNYVWWEGCSRPKYPNMIDISELAQEKNGLILTPRIDNKCVDYVLLSEKTIIDLNMYPGMMVAWEDHKTRGTGAARIKQGNIPDNEIHMSKDAYDAADIVEHDDVVVYSAEPPIEKVDVMEVEVELEDNFGGKCAISPRMSLALDLGGRSGNEVLAFEDPLTGAFGAAKVILDEDLPDGTIKIDSEIYEASGIGSDVVEIKINKRPIIPIQSATIGINPLEGDQVWDVLSKARRYIGQLKSWLSNYIVFKELKLRWKQAGAAIKILDSTPDLSGDVLAEFKPTTNILLKPEGLVTFNAILIIDISRSMMAKDLEVKQIGPAIEGIRAAMSSKEIQDFLKNFKEGTLVPRRLGAAFAAILFLAEKVGRGFGEKVAIIRFADVAEVLDFDGSPFMEGSSGAKDVLERAAKKIVADIGNSYGQATNMGAAMLLAQELIYQMQDMEGGEEQAKPVMVILLTDGYPTDGDNFNIAVQELSKNQNVVFYILGLGSPDVKAMTKAAAICGGEFYTPEDAGKLLIWYSKRARDLQVKLKAHKARAEDEEEEW